MSTKKTGEISLKTMKKKSFPKTISIYGAGKVGRALFSHAKKSGMTVSLHSARKGLPKKGFASDFLILSVREKDLSSLCEEMIEKKSLRKGAVAVHCAGSLSSEILAPLRQVGVSVAQMHPMISFASTRKYPSLEKGNMHVEGDKKATQTAFSFARALGMIPRHIPGLNPVLYHAAAAFVANGSAALLSVGLELLKAAKVSEKDARSMLSALLRSVADNVDALGFPDALTGPVRRGDVSSVQKHFERVARYTPQAKMLYLASTEVQLKLARELGENSKKSFDEIEAFLKA